MNTFTFYFLLTPLTFSLSLLLPCVSFFDQSSLHVQDKNPYHVFIFCRKGGGTPCILNFTNPLNFVMNSLKRLYMYRQCLTSISAQYQVLYVIYPLDLARSKTVTWESDQIAIELQLPTKKIICFNFESRESTTFSHQYAHERELECQAST